MICVMGTGTNLLNSKHINSQRQLKRQKRLQKQPLRRINPRPQTRPHRQRTREHHLHQPRRHNPPQQLTHNQNRALQHRHATEDHHSDRYGGIEDPPRDAVEDPHVHGEGDAKDSGNVEEEKGGGCRGKGIGGVGVGAGGVEGEFGALDGGEGEEEEEGCAEELAEGCNKICDSLVVIRDGGNGDGRTVLPYGSLP